MSSERLSSYLSLELPRFKDFLTKLTVSTDYLIFPRSVKANSHGMFCTYGKKHIWKKHI